MNRQKLSQQVIGTMLITLLLVGCGAPAATPTPIPPTATPTPVPPTATPTTGPPTSTPTPAFTLATSIKDIVGTWHSSVKDRYLRFNEDGTLHQSHSLDRLDTHPYAICEIWFEGTQMYNKEKAVSGVPSCGDTLGIYEVRLYPDGKIQIVKIKDKCSPRAGDTALKLDPVTLEPTATPELPAKILFVGNSLTDSNGGLDVHLERLAGSANPPLVIEAESVVRLGGTLETLWEVKHAYIAINEGNYDVVVLQGDIPETDVDTFHEYARKFVAEIKEAGAEPVLFMAWSYERLGWITMDEIAQAHFDIAMELGVDVAPIGLAWQRAMEERPELDLYSSDGEHPSISGTYLAVNVVYATVFGKSPIGLAYLPPEGLGVTVEEAALLQRIAWETVQEYQMQQ